MPYAEETRGKNGRPSKFDLNTEMLHLFEFPAVYDLGKMAAEAWAREPDAKGTKDYYGGIMAVICEGVIRITGSVNGALQLTAFGDNWQECAARFEAFTKQVLASTHQPGASSNTATRSWFARRDCSTRWRRSS